MFKPRHAYKSPIVSRYRGKAKGCPVFNNLTDVDSLMVEQHDECLECLSKIKNRTDLYRALVDNNKPSNNVIKGMQKLSSSASNNNLKTCLQFLIIKVNENDCLKSRRTSATNSTNAPPSCHSEASSPKSTDAKETYSVTATTTTIDTQLEPGNKHHPNNKQKRHTSTYNQQHKQLNQQKQLLLPSPQDQVSSTQDQVGSVNVDDDVECRTSPSMMTQDQPDELVSDNDEHNDERQHQENLVLNSTPSSSRATTTILKHDESIGARNHSSPQISCTLPSTTDINSKSSSLPIDKPTCPNSKIRNRTDSQQETLDANQLTSPTSSAAKRRKIQNSSDHDTSSTTSWSSSYNSPPTPISNSAISPEFSNHSPAASSPSSSLSSLSRSPSPVTWPELTSDLRRPRLKISEHKIRKINKRPISFEDDYDLEHSFANTPTTSSGCSPGQHSCTTQSSDGRYPGLLSTSCYGSNQVIHTFQAPAKFVNHLKVTDLPAKKVESIPKPTSTPNNSNKEMIYCAICGIRDRPPNIGISYGQNSCLLCSKFFASFLKNPHQLYCAQDGDCLMTFDSRCQACWIKICLQKFDISEEQRQIGFEYSPKLLSTPLVSLITVNTSPSR